MNVAKVTEHARCTVQGQGPTLLLVAGTGYAGATWAPAMIENLRADHTVITYDHRGTAREEEDPGEFSTRDLAADALKLLDALGLTSAHVLGHSMGGRVAQWMALDAPETIASLALAASGPGARPGTPGHTWGIPVETAVGIAEQGYRDYVTGVQRRTFFTPEFALVAPAAVDWLADAFWESRPSLIAYLRHVAARQQHCTIDRLREIRSRTLVVVGDRDTHRGGTGSHLQQSEVLARSIPGARLRVLTGMKHGFLWEMPRESAELIRRWVATGDE